MDFHLIRWETISRLFDLSSQDRLDALHDLLTVNELHEDIRKELQVLLSNHLIKSSERIDKDYFFLYKVILCTISVLTFLVFLFLNGNSSSKFLNIEMYKSFIYP